MEQIIIEADGVYDELGDWLVKKGVNNLLVVCGRSIRFHRIDLFLRALPRQRGIRVTRFMEFQPNPLYENVTEGVRVFRREQCDAIFAVGGGSAMDVAKCVKLYSTMDGDGQDGDFLRQEIVPNRIPLIAMPTTAGTGSEATRFAVIYYRGAKQSVADESCIPGAVLMDSAPLRTLPLYQKKASMMDALCHAIESFWSVNSTEESREYSRQAIESFLRSGKGCLGNEEACCRDMLQAANLAGKAINITQTTAGHAMCYKITSLFGCAHGHAAILCDRVLYAWMLDNTEKCVDPRGERYLKETLEELGRALGCDGARAGAERLRDIFEEMELPVPSMTEEQCEELTASVNPVRLKNHPVQLDTETIKMLYHQILNGETK